MSMKLLGSFVIAACASAALFFAPAFAADAPAGTSVREVCAADYTTFCADKEPRSDDGRACMRAHRAEFSEPCRTALEARRKEVMEKIRAACGPEIAKFCSAPSPADEGPRHCLRDHEADLSQTCKAAFPSHQG